MSRKEASQREVMQLPGGKRGSFLVEIQVPIGKRESFLVVIEEASRWEVRKLPDWK